MSPGDAERSTAGPRLNPAAGAGRRSAWRAAAFAAAGSLMLHGAAVLWVWHSGGFGRVGVLAWIDFPSSLAYLRPRGGAPAMGRPRRRPEPALRPRRTAAGGVAGRTRPRGNR